MCFKVSKYLWYTYTCIPQLKATYIGYVLTSTKNASHIVTDFLAMIKENEQ